MNIKWIASTWPLLSWDNPETSASPALVVTCDVTGYVQSVAGAGR